MLNGLEVLLFKELESLVIWDCASLWKQVVGWGTVRCVPGWDKAFGLKGLEEASGWYVVAPSLWWVPVCWGGLQSFKVARWWSRWLTITVGLPGNGGGLGWEVCCHHCLGMWLFVAWVTWGLEICWTGWGCDLVGGEGFGMHLGLGFCGSGSGAGVLVNMSCWIGWMCYLVLHYLLPWTLDVVALWARGSVHDGGRMQVHWSARDRNSTSWPGSSCDMGFMLWALLKYCFGFSFWQWGDWRLLPYPQGVDGLPRHCIILLLRISLCKGIFGPMRVDHRSSRRSSMMFQHLDWCWGQSFWPAAQ